METIIDFEDLPAGSPVFNHYYSQGITISSGVIDNAPGVAYTDDTSQGTHYLRVPEPPLTITFHPGGAWQVQLYAGSVATSTVLALLEAYDFQGMPIIGQSPTKILGQDDFTNPEAPRQCQTSFTVSGVMSGKVIASVTLKAFAIEPNKVSEPIQVIDHLKFQPAPVIAGPPAHRPEIIQLPWFEHSVHSLILAGIRLGEGGVVLGPNGPAPVPPIRPEERAILAAFVANGVAQMIDDLESRRVLQHAALGVIAREATRLSEGL